MSDVSHRHRADLAGHPDEMEMRQRYNRVMGGRDVALVDAPLFLAGLYAAVSSYTLHFTTAQPGLSTNNLIMGIAVAVLALGLSRAENMRGLSLAIAGIGIWLAISPWVVGRHPDAGMIVSNIVVGAVILLLALVSAGVGLMRRGRRRREAAAAQQR
ncbi:MULTISPECIES: SPW repeat protein [unclassified Streptomyces]|uniref:SPW repeat protein n=1 Tax=Streptomyces millisiae TaxID=3075542 RepID=A0ABU2LWP2_9ACTN|nr:SPW repeat protein [Streptomyces sp. DSM 44918]MDT0321693.1 SPW repeat protein [Streptomyces sp. DSM 44918]